MNIKSQRILLYLWLLIILLTAGVTCAGLYEGSLNKEKYDIAIDYMTDKNYDDAIDILRNLNYKDAETLKEEAEFLKDKDIYSEACSLRDDLKYEEAIDKFTEIEYFANSKEEIIDIKYNWALQCFENGDYEKAKYLLTEISDYKESAEYLKKINNTQLQLEENTYNIACDFLKNEEYEEALENFSLILGYNDSKEKSELCKENIKRLELSHVITGGMYNSFGIADDGTVLSAGNNNFGQCNVELWENIVSIDNYAEFTIGLTKEGKVNVSGKLSEEQKENISKWEHIIDIATGDLFVVALNYDGTVIAEGHNGDKQCNVDDWEDIIDIDAGWRFTVGLTSTGELKFAGIIDNLEEDYLKTKDEWKDVVKIVASGGDPKRYHTDRGKGHVVGLKSDGTLVAIGDNSQGQCDIYEDEWKTKFVAIAAGDWYTVGLTEDGKILITGENMPGRRYIDQKKIDDWNKENIKNIAAGYGQTLILKNEGSVDGIWFQDFEIISNDVNNWEKPVKH